MTQWHEAVMPGVIATSLLGGGYEGVGDRLQDRHLTTWNSKSVIRKRRKNEHSLVEVAVGWVDEKNQLLFL